MDIAQGQFSGKVKLQHQHSIKNIIEWKQN